MSLSNKEARAIAERIICETEIPHVPESDSMEELDSHWDPLVEAIASALIESSKPKEVPAVYSLFNLEGVLMPAKNGIPIGGAVEIVDELNRVAGIAAKDYSPPPLRECLMKGRNLPYPCPCSYCNPG